MASRTTDIFFGLDVGGTNIKAVAALRSGEVVARIQEGTPANGSVREALRACVNRLSSRVAPPRAIGIAVPGLVAPDGLSLAHLPREGQDLVGVRWQDYLGFHRPVPMINDAQAALVGERWLGAARGCDHVMMLTLGTGVGGAAIVDGKLLRGWLRRAGTIGHTSLDPFAVQDAYGCPGAMESFVGNGSVFERTSGRFDSTSELICAVAAGDAQAAAVWSRSIQALAAAVASAINMMDPQRVVIGGGIAQAGDTLFKPLRDWLEKFEWRPLLDRQVEIVPAELGADAGPLGAASIAIDL